MGPAEPAAVNRQSVPQSLVVIPTYNESENIENLVHIILGLTESLGVIIVDDNSPDGTGLIAQKLADTYPNRVLTIHREGKQGLGTAYLAGFKLALIHPEVERVLSMDADFSHHPRYLPSLLEKSSQGFDLVIGSRYVAGGATPDFPVHRRLLSWGANAFVHIMLGLKARDATAGFRCYQRHVLDALDLDAIFSNGYSFLIEMLYLVQSAGFRIGEVPITFEDRKLGASKISQNEIFKALYTVYRLVLRRLFDWR